MDFAAWRFGHRGAPSRQRLQSASILHVKASLYSVSSYIVSFVMLLIKMVTKLLSPHATSLTKYHIVAPSVTLSSHSPIGHNHVYPFSTSAILNHTDSLCFRKIPILPELLSVLPEYDLYTQNQVPVLLRYTLCLGTLLLGTSLSDRIILKQQIQKIPR